MNEKLLHPDKNPDNKAAEERFKEISEAYEHLASEDKRKAHDSQLQAEEANRRAAAVRKESSVEIWPIVIGAIAFLAIVIGLVGLLASPNRKKS
jgi:curved DNA-binding protein CbpA